MRSASPSNSDIARCRRRSTASAARSDPKHQENPRGPTASGALFSSPAYTQLRSTAEEELSHDHPTRRLQLWAASPHDRRRIGAYLHVSLLACQRRTGAVFSNQASFRREQVTFTGKATTWSWTAESARVVTFNFLSDLRLHGLLGERKFSRTRHCCHRKLRRPEFPGADRLGVGGVTPPLGFVAARYSAHANGEAGVTTSHLRSVPGQKPKGFQRASLIRFAFNGRH